MSKQSSSVFRSSFLLGSGTVASRTLGFFRAILLAQTVGVVASVGADDFAVANQLPNSIYVLVSGGVLAATLVPAVVKSATHGDGGKAYINKLMTITILMLLTITTAMVILSPVLIRLYALSWSADQHALATAFAYWTLPQIFFYGLYAILGEVLNAKGYFGPYTWAPALNNVVGIGGLVLFLVAFGSDYLGHWTASDWSPAMIAMLAGTATLGVVAQAVMLMFYWKKIGLGFRPDFKWRGVGLGETGKAAGWTFGIALITQLSILFQTNVVAIASGDGASVFTLTNAWLIFLLPHSIFAVSLGTVYFTKMSKAHTEKNTESMVRSGSLALRNTALIISFSAAALFAAAFPLSKVFTRSPEDAGILASLIMVLVLSLPAFSSSYLAFRKLLVIGKTRSMFMLTVLQCVIFIALTLLSSELPTDFITFGVCVGLTISFIVQAVVSRLYLQRQIPELAWSKVLGTDIRGYAAGAIAAVIGLLIAMSLGAFTDSGFINLNIFTAIVAIAIVGIVSLVCYLGLLAALRTAELKDLRALIRRQ